jgi:hypothetical protein
MTCAPPDGHKQADFVIRFPLNPGDTVRVVILAAVFALSACVSDNLSSSPPAGVDFTGKWKLNEAESDDPLHLLQTANSESVQGAGNGGSGGRGGRGGRGGGGVGAPTMTPPTPGMGALADALRFPGKQLDIKQVNGVVAFTSDGRNRVCQPGGIRQHSRHHSGSSNQDRDAPLPSAREAPPPTCAWSEKTLIVRGTRDPDDDRPPSEERYTLSEDGQRLVEEVGFRGGRSNGFTMSRVWDRLPP